MFENLIKQKLRLDLSTRNDTEVIYAKHGDINSRYVEGYLVNANEKYIPPQNTFAVVNIYKSNNHVVMISSNDENPKVFIENDKVYFMLTDQMLTEVGTLEGDVRLFFPSATEGEDYVSLGTAVFKIVVHKNAVPNGAIESEDVLVPFSEGLSKLNTWNNVFQEEFNVLDGRYETELTNVKSRLAHIETDLSQIKKGATLALAHYDSKKGEYVNLDQYFNSLRNGKIYTVEFNQFNISPSPVGTKKDDNVGLICEPSTSTFRGRNDYEKIGLFMSIDVNAFVDENDDYHVTAIKGDGRFKNDGTNGDVYVMAMVGYVKRYFDDNVWGISYSDAMHSGFEVIDEAMKPDGTVRPFLLHAKYGAGRNPHENNNLASISGTSPEWQEMSHNDQITKFKAKGLQYSGKTSHDDFYVQLMFWLKYANLNNETVMRGCISYYLQYTNLVAETGVKRVIITNAQANNLVVGSTVSIGDYGTGSINVNRQMVQNYNIANRVNILDIVDLGNSNSAVYVDSPNVFNTKLTTTISTYPWNTGACDNVLGTDGSPFSNMSSKEPFIINGIEMMLGGYEILQNLIIYNNNTDPNNYKIQLYACYDCRNYATTPNTHYDLVSHELAQTNNSWAYISKLGIDNKHPSIMVPIGTSATSTTGFADGLYTNTPTTGYRSWRSLGYLSNGSICGLRYLIAYDGLAGSNWALLGRLSATGRSRRRAGVN